MKWTRTMSGIAALGAATTLALAGCSSSGAPSATSDPGAGDDDYSIAFIQGVAGDEFYISMQCGIEDAAAELGATVDVQGPAEWDPTLQKPIVDAVVAKKPDALLIAPNDLTAMEAPIAAAAAAGIKVVLVDTTLSDPSMAVSQISSDNIGGGEAAFEAIKAAQPGGGKVLVVSNEPGISTTDERAEGFEAAAAQDPNFESVGIQYSHNDPAEAARLVTAALAKDPDIVGIFAANLFAAEGSTTGVQQAGKAGEITIVGFDAGPAQVKALKDGVVQALIAQDPATIGSDGVAQAIAALKGEATDEKIQTGSTTLTADNIDTDGADAIYKSSCN
ncbi:ABC transporter substrate-binding protein [Microbacterium sp. C23T]